MSLLETFNLGMPRRCRVIGNGMPGTGEGKCYTSFRIKTVKIIARVAEGQIRERKKKILKEPKDSVRPEYT